MVIQAADTFFESMTRSRPRHYRKGSRRQVTTEWIASVRAKLDELDKGPRWLETEVGLAKGAASKILDGKQQTSNHVDAISLRLEIAPPVVMVEGRDEIELLAEYRRLNDEGKAHILGLLRVKSKS